MFQVFPQNADLAPSKRVKFGIDPTFPRLHLGHLVPLRLVKKMINHGHDVTIVLGTFTAQMGDPSGRDTTRPILTHPMVHANAEKILQQLKVVLGDNCLEIGVDTEVDNPNLNGWKLFRNNSVFGEMRLPDFMRIASQFSLAHMTSRNAFQERIENHHPIALQELLVPLCQGWDSVHLKSEVEIGGQDQLFNFQIARQLQEQNGQKPQANIMMPIIRGTNGQKMSKSLGNCVFLDENPKDMFGQIMSIPDDVMVEWTPLLTDIETIGFTQLHPMQQKKKLATDIVVQLHGGKTALEALDNFEKTIQNKEVPESIQEIWADTLIEAVAIINKSSKSAARQLINNGGVKVNGGKIQNPLSLVTSGQIIQAGKRSWAKIS